MASKEEQKKKTDKGTKPKLTTKEKKAKKADKAAKKKGL